MKRNSRELNNLKDLGPNLYLIVEELLKNDNLCKLLYYKGKDPLREDCLIDNSILINNGIFVVPNPGPQKDPRSYIIPIYTNGERNSENGEYKDLSLSIHIYVPLDQWVIEDKNFRQFLIMHEILNSLIGFYIDGVGQIEGGDFILNLLTEEMSSYVLELFFTTSR